MANGASGSTVGAGTWLTAPGRTARDRSLRGPSSVASAQPWRPEAYSIGKSSWLSVAPSAANRSNTSVWTSSGRASWRSILLTTTIGWRPRASALPTTNLVCGSTPSAASTSTMAPSTMFRMRSTSPPKSAWPGVSTMLMRDVVPDHRGALGQDGDAALALQVVAVERALGHLLVLAEGAGLARAAGRPAWSCRGRHGR